MASLLPFAGNADAQEPGDGTTVDLQRLGGEDRYETAKEIAEDGWDSASVVYVASGQHFDPRAPGQRFTPDSLAGNYIAGQTGSPILLTQHNQANSHMLAALDSLDADEVVLLGGEMAINTSVANAIRAQGYDVSRIGGEDRYETAADIAVSGDTIGEIDGEVYAILARGDLFPDALTGGPLAYDGALPLLLQEGAGTGARGQRVNPHTLGALEDLDVDHVLILGQSEAISNAVQTQLQGAGYATTRVGGPGRIQTAHQIADWAADNLGFDFTSMSLARGDLFPDALTGGPHSGERQAPILLTWSPTSLDRPATATAQQTEATTNREFLEETCPDEIVVFGGPSAVNNSVAEAAADAASCEDEGPDLDATLTLSQTQADAGEIVTGTVSGEGITGLSVAGDCVENGDLELTSTGDDQWSFEVQISEDAEDGSCQLTFTVEFEDGSTQTITRSITVGEDPDEPTPPGAALTDAPELINVTLQREFTTEVRFAFQFDQVVAPDGLDPTRFFLNLWDGGRIQATSVVRDDRGTNDGFSQMRDDTVRAVFPKVMPRHATDGTAVPDNPSITDSDDMVTPGHYPTHAGAAATASSTPVWSGPDTANPPTGWNQMPNPGPDVMFPITWQARTAASVAYRAVRSPADDLLVNPEGSRPLMGQSLPARFTQFPDLTGVDNWIFQLEAQHPQGFGNTVQFIFDRPISDIEIEAAMANSDSETDVGFGLILQGGTVAADQSAGAYVLRGYKIERVEGAANRNRLRVYFESDFLNPSHDPNYLTSGVQSEAARAYVDQNVFDATTWNLLSGDSGEGEYNGPGPVTTFALRQGGITARPDITGVRLLDTREDGVGNAPGGDRAVFTFNTPVTNPYAPVGADPGSDQFRIWHQQAVEAFHAYHYNGWRETAIYAERFGQNANEVVVTFPHGTLMSASGVNEPNKSVTGFGINGWTDYSDSGNDPHHHNCRQLPGTGPTSNTVVWSGNLPTLIDCENRAAVRDSGNQTLNEPHIFGVGQTFAAGETLAPNLTGVRISVTDQDSATGEITEYTVTYVFSRAVSQDMAWNDRFTLYDTNGVRRTAECDGTPHCVVGPSTARNEVRILASAGSGGYSLIAGRDAVLGGTVWNTVHNQTADVGGAPGPYEGHPHETTGFLVGLGPDQRGSAGYTWHDQGGINELNGFGHGTDQNDANFIVNFESSRAVQRVGSQ